MHKDHNAARENEEHTSMKQLMVSVSVATFYFPLLAPASSRLKCQLVLLVFGGGEVAGGGAAEKKCEIRDQNAAVCIFTGVTPPSPVSGTDPDAL